MASVLLYAPQDFHNLCLIARTLEALGHRECFVFDPHGLVRERYGKMRKREIRAVSAGAFDKLVWTRVDRPEVLLAEHAGRVVATVAAPDAVSLFEHAFEGGELVVFGAESTGLPPEVVEASDVALTIPLRGQTRSLNLAVSVGMVLFEVERQRRVRPG